MSAGSWALRGWASVALTLGWWGVGGVGHTASFSGDDPFVLPILAEGLPCAWSEENIPLCAHAHARTESDTQSQEALG